MTGRIVLLLAVMWVFGTYHAGTAALTHFQDRSTAADLVAPAQPVLAALQEERRLTALLPAGADDGPDRDRLTTQRTRTDAAVAVLRRSAARARVSWTGTPAAAAATRLLDRLAALPATRRAADARPPDRSRLAAAYTEAAEAALGLAATTWPRTDTPAADRQRALTALSRSGELLAREDTLVSGAATPAGAGVTLTAAERAELTALAGARRAQRAQALAVLAGPDRAALSALGDLTGGPDARFAAAEDALLRGPGTLDEAAWRAAADPALAAVHEVVTGGVRAGVTAAAPAGVSAVAQAGLFGSLGLVAVLAAYAAARRRTAVPAGVATGASGATAALPQDDATAAVLLRLTRRNQALLHRQLGVLDQLERREAGAADLAALFRADHLATQMRRNLEKAILLGGHEPGRRWRHPVPLIDVARAAAASVERHAAVMVTAVAPAALTGPAVGAVMHLLTELIDNATRFTPGEATVWVTGELGPEAYTVLVQDRGPGMSAAELAAARALLADPSGPPEPGDPAGTGLRLAGRLARAHDITIDLDEAPRGGITARVGLPLTLLAETPNPVMPPAPDLPPDLPPDLAPDLASDLAPDLLSGLAPELVSALAPEQVAGRVSAAERESAAERAAEAEPAAVSGPRAGGLPVRAPRPVPGAVAGLARRRPGRSNGAGSPDPDDAGPSDGSGGTDGPDHAVPPVVDRAARFRDRLAARAPGRSARASGAADHVDEEVNRDVGLPAQPDAPAQESIVDDNGQP